MCMYRSEGGRRGSNREMVMVYSSPCLRRSSYVFLLTTFPSESSYSSCSRWGTRVIPRPTPSVPQSTHLIFSSPGILCLAKFYLLPHCREMSHDCHMTLASVVLLTCPGILNVSDICKMSCVRYSETPHAMRVSPLLGGEGAGLEMWTQ